mmetsp:Transcript_14334/g.19612  ORF Transcript_14334/g.19612 Transcript_14334/m.19612 type:complete len:89 (-) Transcript_14334:283-549(-)
MISQPGIYNCALSNLNVSIIHPQSTGISLEWWITEYTPRESPMIRPIDFYLCHCWLQQNKIICSRIAALDYFEYVLRDITDGTTPPCI